MKLSHWCENTPTRFAVGEGRLVKIDRGYCLPLIQHHRTRRRVTTVEHRVTGEPTRGRTLRLKGSERREERRLGGSGGPFAPLEGHYWALWPQHVAVNLRYPAPARRRMSESPKDVNATGRIRTQIPRSRIHHSCSRRVFLCFYILKVGGVVVETHRVCTFPTMHMCIRIHCKSMGYAIRIYVFWRWLNCAQ